MPTHQDELYLNLPLSEAMAACRNGMATLGWRVKEQGEARLTGKQPFSFTTGNPVAVDILATAESPATTKLTLKGSSFGYGPLQSRHLKKQMALLRSVIALASRPATTLRACPSCNSEVPEGARFCMKCGKEIAPPPAPVLATHPETAGGKQPGRRWLAVVIAALTLAIVAVAADRALSSLDADTAVGVAGVTIVLASLAFLAGVIMLVVQAVRSREWQGGAILAGASLAVMVVGVVLGIRYDGLSEGETAATGPEATSPPAPAETIEQVLARAVNITSARFDLVMTVAGESSAPETMRFKGNRIRTDTVVNGQPAVIVQNTDTRTLVTYLPTQKQAVRTQMEADDKGLAAFSPIEMARKTLKQGPAVLGTETTEGRPTLLIEGTGEDGERYRMWIDREFGVPLRGDFWTPEGKGTLEWKNAEFFYIPDYVFEVPPDVKVTGDPVPDSKPAPPPAPANKPSPTPLPVTVPRLYTNPEFRYSIEVPEGWTIDDSVKSNLKIRAPVASTMVQVFASTGKSTLESWVSSTTAFRAQNQDFQEISRQKVTLPGSLPAYAIEARWTIRGNTALSRNLSVITLKTDRKIELLAYSLDTNWERYRAQLEKAAYSLAIAE